LYACEVCSHYVVTDAGMVPFKNIGEIVGVIVFEEKSTRQQTPFLPLTKNALKIGGYFSRKHTKYSNNKKGVAHVWCGLRSQP